METMGHCADLLRELFVCVSLSLLFVVCRDFSSSFCVCSTSVVKWKGSLRETGGLLRWTGREEGEGATTFGEKREGGAFAC